MSNVNGPRGNSFSTPPVVPHGDQETAREKGVINPKSNRYVVQGGWGSSLNPGKPFHTRRIRNVPVLDIKIRGLLKSDHFRDVERALNNGGDIKAERRQLQPDRKKVEEILKDIQAKAAKNEVDLDTDFSTKLKEHLKELKEVDLSTPKELAKIIISTMDDIRDWHFNAGYDKTLITGKQLIDSEGKLRDILSNYSAVNPGETKQEDITPLRVEVSGDWERPVSSHSTDDQTTSALHNDTTVTRPDGEQTPEVISDNTLILPNGHKMPALIYKATDEDGESGYGSDVSSPASVVDETTSPASPVDQGTETSPASLAWLASTSGTQTSPVPDGPAGLMSELAD
ncbi:hypothetical protein, partial [Endozoicomonas sp. ONNA2]|uniref:hypothetical protein n=1 Tax=Endozoicomonas sp. ONNA2 TaxID=2828741 RepID=UPI002147E1F9